MLKNYIYNQKSNEFDAKNFNFGRNMLDAKRREDLGDKKVDFKEMLIGGFSQEKNQIDTDGYVNQIYFSRQRVLISSNHL